MSIKLLASSIGNILVLLLYFVLPFEHIPSIDIFGFTVKLSYIIGLALLAWGLVNIRYILKQKDSISDRLLALFWLCALISMIFGFHQIHNIIYLGLWSFMFGLYYIVSRFPTSNPVFDTIEKIILWSTTLVCLVGLYQFIGDSLGLSTHLTGLRFAYTRAVLGFPRIQSVGLEPLYFSNFLLVPLFLALKKYLNQKSLFGAYWWLVILIMVNIILGQSRGAYLAVSIALVILVVRFIGQKTYRQISNLVLMIAISLLLAIGLVAYNGKDVLTGNFTQHALVQDDTNQGSVGGRLSADKSAWNYFRQKPLLGYGPGSYGLLTQKKDSSGYEIVNNEYLEILAETGIVGLLLFLGFLIMLAVESWRAYKISGNTERQTILYLGLGLVAIFIQYNFFSTLYIIYIWAFLALLRSQSNSLSSRA